MTKLTYRTTGDHGVEWAALGDNGEIIGPWRENQHLARLDLVGPVNGPDGYSTEDENE